jgi:hypothetical protein
VKAFTYRRAIYLSFPGLGRRLAARIAGPATQDIHGGRRPQAGAYW